MKIKGAFPVRWAAQNGADGTGVTVANQRVRYASSTQGVNPPTTGWQASIPEVADGNFLWTWLLLVFSDGNQTDIYSSARQGIDGRGIQNSTVTYSQQATSVNPDTITDWGGFPHDLIEGYWLYTKTVITYSDGTHSISYSVSQVGTGAYYAGTEERYAAGVSSETPPDGYAAQGTYVSGQTIQTTWSQERPKLTAETPYLWNFEISSDSRGTRYVTDVVCIGNFAKGIVSIVETYAISAQNRIPDGRAYPSDIAESDWKDEAYAVPPTDVRPFQWNNTTTTYNDGSVQNNYHISAVKGIDGKGAIYIDLDNENDSMLYDGSGNLLSGNMVSNIKLYDNGVDVTSGRTFSVDSSDGVTARILGSTLIITGMSSIRGQVIVKCIYKGVPYYARFTCKKIIGTDKYEIVCTPSALIFNDDTDTGSQVTVVIQVYKTAQNGTRGLLQNLPAGYSLVRKWSDTQTSGTAMTYSGGEASFTPYDNLYDRYRIELLDASNNVLDYETIPINHVTNGADASYYELKPSLDVLSFARNAENDYTPVSLQVCCGYVKIVGSSRTSFSGNNVENLWRIDGKYQIMWRYHVKTGATTGWSWNKDLTNGTLTINGSSEYTAVEFIFTSATGVSYVSDINTFDRVIVPIMREGAKGYNGAKPLFGKFSEIKGKAIQVYKGVGDEEWYTIIYDDVNNAGWYTPMYSHTTTTDEVLTDASKWRMSSMDFVATSVFFAQMAYVENLGVRNVLLSNGKEIEGGMCYSDDNGNKGSLGLGDVRFWLGADKPALGKIRGYKDGKFVAANGKAVFDSSGDVTLCGGNAKFDKNGNTTIANLTATSGKFSGELQSNTGQVGGFKLSDGSLTAKKSTGETLTLSPDLLGFSDDNSGTRNVLVGADVMPTSFGGAARCPMVVEVNGNYSDSPYSNSGMYIDVKGAKIDDSSNVNGNHAIFVGHGDFLGLRPRVRRISGSVTVSKNDFTILTTGSSDNTLTLSSSPEDSEMHFFRKIGSGNMTIKVGNTSSHRLLKKDGSRVTSSVVSNGALICVIWDSVNSIWTYNYMN